MVDLAGISKDTISISRDGDAIGEPAPFNGGFIGPGVAIIERVKPSSSVVGGLQFINHFDEYLMSFSPVSSSDGQPGRAFSVPYIYMVQYLV